VSFNRVPPLAFAQLSDRIRKMEFICCESYLSVLRFFSCSQSVRLDGFRKTEGIAHPSTRLRHR
jgi:hypothetical protein